MSSIAMDVPAPDEVPAEAPAPETILLTPLQTDHGTMALGEVARIALSSLWSNKLRSLLTMLGVIIGVGAVVALMAIGNGASASIQGQVQSIGTNVLTVQPGFGGGFGGRNVERQPGQSGPPQSLTLADYQAIAALQLPLIGIAPQFSSNAQIVAPAADQNASIVGTTDQYADINKLTVASGAWIDSGQVQSAGGVIVLGSNLATNLFGDGQAVGQIVFVKGQAMRVIGVLDSKGGGQFGSVDDRAFAPITFVQQRLGGARTPDGNGYLVSSIQVEAQNAGDLDNITSAISTLLRTRHHLKADGSADDFNVVNQAAFLSTLTSITGTLTAFLAAIAGISLLVGGIGIMNIMLVSVTERTREIGLRKAVGARARDILVQFVAEALTISLTGGIIGLLIGAAIAWGASLTGQVTAVMSPTAIIMAVGFALAVGLFFGIYPAQRAARLNPIDALRFE